MDRQPQAYAQPDYFTQRHAAGPPLSSTSSLHPPPPESQTRFTHQPHHTWSPSNALATHQSPSVPFPSLAGSLAFNAQRLGQYSLPATPSRVPVSVVSFLEALELNEYITVSTVLALEWTRRWLTCGPCTGCTRQTFLNEGFDRME